MNRCDGVNPAERHSSYQPDKGYTVNVIVVSSLSEYQYKKPMIIKSHSGTHLSTGKEYQSCNLVEGNF
jgi:hypothetical protein